MDYKHATWWGVGLGEDKCFMHPGDQEDTDQHAWNRNMHLWNTLYSSVGNLINWWWSWNCFVAPDIVPWWCYWYWRSFWARRCGKPMGIQSDFELTVGIQSTMYLVVIVVVYVVGCSGVVTCCAQSLTKNHCPILHMCVFLFYFIVSNRQRQTGRQAGMQTERQTDGPTQHRWTHRQTKRHVILLCWDYMHWQTARDKLTGQMDGLIIWV